MLPAIAVFLALYAAFVLILVGLGKRSEARALARFIPDCLVLCKRLFGDRRVSQASKLALALLVVYLALPIDLVPDFIPVAGQLDDAILVAVLLRLVLRNAGPAPVDEHWPGPPEGVRIIKRLAFNA